jgi:uncharacterized protein (DUF1015 family)
MPVRPFRALRYATDRVENLARVLAPPYDVISAEEQAALYKRDPHNVIRLEYGRTSDADTAADNRYTRANADLIAWREAGVLTQDTPAYYPHRQRFSWAGTSYTRTGFFAAVELQAFGAGAVLPHEWTLKGPKADRLQLMRTCLASMSPVFGLYDGRHTPLGEVLAQATAAAPLASAHGHGFDDTLWRVNDPTVTAAVTEALSTRQILIADGHHRYETMLALRDDLRAAYPDAPADAAFNYAFMLLVDMHDPGLLILATHRLLTLSPAMLDAFCHAVCHRFEVAPLAVAHPNDITALLARQDGHAFVWYTPGRYQLLTAPRMLRNGLPVLDVQLAQEAVIGPLLAGDPAGTATVESHVRYTINPAQAVARVDAGEAQGALFLNPTPIGDVFTLAAAGERLPQKSTYFYPKVPTGLVLHDLRPTVTVG